MKDEQDKFPGDLPQCEDCMLTLRQCEMKTSANLCKVWTEYISKKNKENT